MNQFLRAQPKHVLKNHLIALTLLGAAFLGAGPLAQAVARCSAGTCGSSIVTVDFCFDKGHYKDPSPDGSRIFVEVCMCGGVEVDRDRCFEVPADPRCKKAFVEKTPEGILDGSNPFTPPRPILEVPDAPWDRIMNACQGECRFDRYEIGYTKFRLIGGRACYELSLAVFCKAIAEPKACASPSFY